MTNTSRHHHFVPQFYLGGFTSTGDKNEPLFVADMVEGRVFWTRPLKVGAKRDFNRIDADGVELDALETKLGEFETDVAPVLREIGERRSLPAGTDMSLLINFVGLLGTRNPKIRSVMENFERRTLKQLMHLMVSSRDVWETYIQRMKDDGIQVLDISYEHMKKFVESDNYDIEFQHGHHVAYELSALDAVLDELFKRQWSLLIADSDSSHFICSDRPVVITDVMPGKSRSVGFGTPGTEVTMPLNKDMVLIGNFGGDRFERTVSNQVVAKINNRTASAAKRQVYAPDDSFKLMVDGEILGYNILLSS